MSYSELITRCVHGNEGECLIIDDPAEWLASLGTDEVLGGCPGGSRVKITPTKYQTGSKGLPHCNVRFEVGLQTFFCELLENHDGSHYWGGKL